MLADTQTTGARRGAVLRRLPAGIVFGGGVVALMILLAFVGPAVSPYAYDQMDIVQRLKGPSAAHWAGTDEYGRDVLTRTLLGTRTSLFIGFGATLVSLVFGVILGLIAGHRRG